MMAIREPMRCAGYGSGTRAPVVRVREHVCRPDAPERDRDARCGDEDERRSDGLAELGAHDELARIGERGGTRWPLSLRHGVLLRSPGPDACVPTNIDG